MRRAVRLIGNVGRRGRQAPRLGAGFLRRDAAPDTPAPETVPPRGLTARELIEMARSARAAMQQRRP